MRFRIIPKLGMNSRAPPPSDAVDVKALAAEAESLDGEVRRFLGDVQAA